MFEEIPSYHLTDFIEDNKQGLYLLCIINYVHNRSYQSQNEQQKKT